MRVAGVRGPRRRMYAPEAVGDQHGGLACGQQHVFQPRDPVATQRAHPVMLLHAPVTVGALPAALPVRGTAALPAGKNQDVARFHSMQAVRLLWFLSLIHISEPTRRTPIS